MKKFTGSTMKDEHHEHGEETIEDDLTATAPMAV
jgi:hypothetical protein